MTIATTPAPASAPTYPARTITPADAEWPDNPTGFTRLYVRGADLRATLGAAPVGIIGARSGTTYGQHVAEDWAQALTRSGRTVVASLAFGIDSNAIRGALVADGHPVVVAASGVTDPYPTAHRLLQEAVLAAGGTVVSAYPDGTTHTAQHFAIRARLLTLLVGDVVIPEAARSSHSYVAARVAAANDRRVWGVPGPITSALSAGVHDLIASGTARLAAQVSDVLHP